MTRKTKYLIIISIFLVLSMINLLFYYSYLKPIKISDINYSFNDEKIYATIHFKDTREGSCSYQDSYALIENKSCTLEVLNEEGKATIKSKWIIKEVTINPNIHEVLSLSVSSGNMYLVVGEKREIKVQTEQIGNPNLTYTIESSNEEIVKVDDNKIIGLKDGEATIKITLNDLKEEFKVIVTS